MQGRTKEIKVTVTGGGVPLRLAVGVSIGAISLILVMFLIFWKRKYPASTQIERGEDGAGKYCLLFFPLYFDLSLNVRNNKGMILHNIWITTLSWEQGLTSSSFGAKQALLSKLLGFFVLKLFLSVFKVPFVLEIRLKSYFWNKVVM